MGNIAGTVTAPIMTEEKYEEIHGNWLYMLLMFGSIIFFWISQQMLFGVAGTFLSAWCSNHTRSNTENSQCITTRLRLDTTKRTSRSLICLDLRETLRSSSS